jgi:hypothetical protein
MVKIRQTGLLKFNFETYQKNAFSGFCQKFPQAMDEVKKNFFANFQILGPLGCQGWVVIPQNVKISQNHCTLLYLCTEEYRR